MCTKVLFSPILVWILISSITAEEKVSNPRILKECPLTEYKKFVQCAEKLLLALQKEQEITENISKESNTNCNKCDCNVCKAEDFADTNGSSCCQTCCPFVSCENKKCCFKTCHSLCETLECRTSCRQSCLKYVETQRSNHLSEQLNKAEILNDDDLNITTRINVTNLINNVNNISAPIQVRSSNINDFTIETTNNNVDTKQITNQPCCEVISPTTCRAASRFPFVNCQFNKTSQCGDTCLKNQFGISRPPCGFNSFGCGNLNNLYQIGHILSNVSFPKIKNNESEVTTSPKVSYEVHQPEPTAQFMLPQNYINQNIVPSFNYPPMYTNLFPRHFYNSYAPSLPSNPIFTPSYARQYITNPFYSSNMMYRYPFLYPPIYNEMPVSRISMYPNMAPYPSPTPYYFSGMQPFQNLQPRYNYQIPNYHYQAPQITFPPVYSIFAPPQGVSEIMPSPTIGFKVQPPKNDAEILITNKEEYN